MSRARILVLFAGLAMTLLLGAFTGRSGEGDDEGAAAAQAAATATTAPATTVPGAASSPAGCAPDAECAQPELGVTTKTAVVLTAVAGGVALIWCRRRAKQLLASS